MRLAVAAAAGCAPAHNYAAPLGPRYAGDLAPMHAHASAPAPDRIRVVTFNLQFGVRVDRAIELFRSDPALRGADIVALQEMDARGTSRLAETLGTAYVYYPATVHPKTGRDFGNAIDRSVAETRCRRCSPMPRTTSAWLSPAI